MGDMPMLGQQPWYSQKPRRTMRFLSDFKRNDDEGFFPQHHLSPANSRTHHPQRDMDGNFAELEIAQSGLARRLKGRHLQMIAISGSIGMCIMGFPHPQRRLCARVVSHGHKLGTGLFIMSGSSLATSGPASLLLAFAVAGATMYCTCQALGELAVVFPIAGSFSSWATRFLDPSWGFALGWK